MDDYNYINKVRLGEEAYWIKDTVSGYVTNSVSDLMFYTKTANLANVATSGNYNDLTGKPSLPSFAGYTMNVTVKQLGGAGGSTETDTTTTFYALGDSGNQDYSNRTSVIDLRNYVLKTRLPIAGTAGVLSGVSGMGCINLSPNYGFALESNYNYLQVQTVADMSAYNQKDSAFAISKGTLEIVLAGKNYLQANNYATNNNGGTIRTASNYGTEIAMSSGATPTPTGQLCATVFTYSNYGSASNQLFISKGTLENVITGKGLIDNTVSNLVNYTPTNSLASVALTGDYSDLLNKPIIPIVNNGILTIQQNGATIDSFSANASLDTTVNIIVPTSVSDLINDSNFIDPTYFTTITGYDANETQILKHVQGTLTWETIPTSI